MAGHRLNFGVLASMVVVVGVCMVATSVMASTFAIQDPSQQIHYSGSLDATSDFDNSIFHSDREKRYHMNVIKVLQLEHQKQLELEQQQQLNDNDSDSASGRSVRPGEEEQYHIRVLQASEAARLYMSSLKGLFVDPFNDTWHLKRDSDVLHAYVRASTLSLLLPLVPHELLFVISHPRDMYARDVVQQQQHDGNKQRDANPFQFSIYHDYNSLTRFLRDINTLFADITQLYSIGQSVEGREIWVMEISDNPGVVEPNEPEFKYVGNMHGDEVVGRELLLRFIYDLCFNYRSGDPAAMEIVNKVRLSIIPTMNPDGFERRGRANARGYDLNRYVDQQRSPTTIVVLAACGRRMCRDSARHQIRTLQFNSIQIQLTAVVHQLLVCLLSETSPINTRAQDPVSSSPK
jgi:hypothetical protein